MSHKLLYFIISALLVSTLWSCNKDSDSGVITVSSTTVAISSFSLTEDDDVLENLDSIFFSIDLDKAEIYNADSLPYGTDISKLIPVIGTGACSVAELHVPRVNQADTIVNYLTNPTDTIDFSNGPVILHVASANLEYTRDYTIRVNVHQMKPDSLYWNNTARRSLPTNVGIPARQKTVVFQGSAICLTNAGSRYCLALSDNPGNDDWQTSTVTFPFTPKVESFNATSDTLYITDTDGNLYSSTDGETWTSCGISVSHIYGGYGDQLLAARSVDGKFYQISYPSAKTLALDDDFPVSGTSTLINISNSWSDQAQVYMLGGVKASGEMTGAMWGYDGNSWAKISDVEVPAARDRTLVSYVTFITDSTSWTTKKYATLVAFGGRNADNVVDKTLYISLNMGMNWKVADELLQLPDYIPAMEQAQGYVFDSTFTADQSRRRSSWEELSSRQLPRYWQVDYGTDGITPITSWQCPYIYIFGGLSADGQLYNTIWRGTINRLTFKPLQ